MRPNNDFYERIGISSDLLESMDDVFETMEQEELDQIVEYVELNQKRNEMVERSEDTKDISLQIDSLSKDLQNKINRIPTFDEIDMDRTEYREALSDNKKAWKEVRAESAKQIEKLVNNDYDLSVSVRDLKMEAEETAKIFGMAQYDVSIMEKELETDPSPEKTEKLENLKKELQSLKETLDEQTNIYMEEKNRLSQNTKDLAVATFINDLAKTQISQTMAMQREQILAPARGRLEQAQKDLQKDMREFSQDVQRVGSQLKTHIVVGRKISDINFTPLRDLKEKITNHEIRRQYKHINKAKKVEMKIEQKALRKHNRAAKRAFKEKVRENNIAKLFGKEVPYKDVEGQKFEKTKAFKDLTPEQKGKAIDSLNKFRKTQLSIIQKDIEYRQGRVAKSLERAAQQRDERNSRVDQVREQAQDRADVTFTRDLEKFTRGLENAEYRLDEKTAAALGAMIESGQIDVDQLTPEAKEFLEEITGMEVHEPKRAAQDDFSFDDPFENDEHDGPEFDDPDFDDPDFEPER